MPNLNPYTAEAAILSRLSSSLTDCTVAAASALSGRVDPTEYCPGVYLKPGEASVQTDALKQKLARREQTWQVHVLEVNHNGTDSLAATRAGDRIALVLDALLGWSPGEGYSAMAYAGEDEPDYLDGYALFTVNFSVKQMVKAI